MKIANVPSKIVGITLGELKINVMGMGPPVTAKFALVSKEGEVVGFIETFSWSEKFEEKIRAFIADIEEEGLRLAFEEPAQASETPPSDAADAPRQF